MIEIRSYPQRRNEFKADDLDCYCFGHTRKEIEKDYIDNRWLCSMINAQ